MKKIALFYLLVSSFLFANGELEKSSVYADETARIIFHFDFKTDDIEVIKVPDIKRAVISGPGKSQQIRIINGSVSQSLKLIFEVSVEKPGKYVIPPLIIKVNNKEVQSPRQTLTVRKENSPQGNWFGIRRRPNYKNGTVKINVEASKRSVYQGELFAIRYKLKTTEFEDPYRKNVDPSNFKGFFAEPFTDNPDDERIIQRNQTISKYLALRYLLVPIKSGTLEIAPHLFYIHDRQGIARPLKVSSKKFILQVNPLPLRKKPENFSGNIGDFVFNVTIQSQSGILTESEPFTVQLNISGDGNFIQYEPPKFINSASTTLLEAKVLEKKYQHQFKNHSGFIRMHYNLIANKSGNLSAGRLKTNWFSLKKQRYIEREILIKAQNFARAKPRENNLAKEIAREKSQYWYTISSSVIAVLILALLFFFSYQRFAKIRSFVAHIQTIIFAKAQSTFVSRSKKVYNFHQRLSRQITQIIGQKSGVLCREYLLSKGVAYADVLKFLEIQKKLEKALKTCPKFTTISQNDIILIDKIANEKL